ncbi:uncharacterized protein EHS24_009558 [Apiotrichum porosum]|uniref:50S ribosomal protein L35 n=1 Tax=Apiotrichum porosum TaxID=105984 RepID=A0A427XM96_9TREE|nr:uncharacterized protein EHS24_009558 [Apiotrichum porosum]RSH79892.1 hypothetical protein EHS24_009558 [Apiotrichum porosum]
MLTATLGLFRPLVASVAGSSRAFSTSPVVEVLKTHSGAKKRWRVTGSGLFKRGQCGKQHLNTSFSASRINRLGKAAYANKAQSKVLRRLLPNA